MARKKKDDNRDYEALNRLKKKDTESRLKDYMYNWIVDRYTRNKREFSWHDQLVWQGSVYTLPEIFGYIAFFALFLWIGSISMNRYGFERTLFFFILLVVWRVQVLIKFMSKMNSKLH